MSLSLAQSILNNGFECSDGYSTWKIGNLIHTRLSEYN